MVRGATSDDRAASSGRVESCYGIRERSARGVKGRGGARRTQDRLVQPTLLVCQGYLYHDAAFVLVKTKQIMTVQSMIVT